MSTLHADPVALLASLSPIEQHEALHLYPAWGALCGYLASGTDPRTIDPRDMVGLVAAWDTDRAVSYLHAHGHADSLLAAEDVLGDLLTMASQGRRPRYAIEIGAGR